MASHKTHQKGAIFAGLIGAFTSFILGMITIPQAIIIFLAGYTGGMAPDLDHDQGKSLRFSFRLISIIIPSIILWRHPELRENIQESLIYFSTMAGILYIPIQFLFKKMTIHRGIFHSVPAIIIYGEIFFLMVGKRTEDLPFQKSAAIIASLGYLTHLLLDEYSSLNFNGQRFKVKRSLGTALDFIKPNRRVTVIAYLLMLALFIPIYSQW